MAEATDSAEAAPAASTHREGGSEGSVRPGQFVSFGASLFGTVMEWLADRERWAVQLTDGACVGRPGLLSLSTSELQNCPPRGHGRPRQALALHQ